MPLLMASPSVVAPPISATAISAVMRPYSTAVTPELSLMNLKNIAFMPHSDSVYLETTQIGSTITGLPAVASNDAQRIRIVLQDGSADSI